MAFTEIAIQFMAWAQSTAAAWGYMGIFLVSLIGSASIIFPVPAFLVIFAMGAVLNPWLVGIVAGIGAGLGEVTGYLVGFAGKELAEKKNRKNRWLEKAKKWTESRGIFTVILVFAATPLPDDITGIIAGAIGYNWKKFLIACIIGKTIMGIALAWGGFFGLNWVLQILGGL